MACLQTIRVRIRWLVVVGAALGLFGSPSVSVEAAATEVRVFLPCGLVGPFAEISAAFQKSRRSVRIRTQVDTMATLLRRVDFGEKPEVLVATGAREMSTLVQRKLIAADSIRPFARASIILITPEKNPAEVGSVKDLISPRVRRVALADGRTDTVGACAEQVLKRLGIWAQVKPKVLRPDRTRTVEKLVASGRAEAGFLLKSCAVGGAQTAADQKAALPHIHLAATLPAQLHDPVLCAAAVVRGCRHPELGGEFVGFLASEGRANVFLKWGFVPAKELKRKGDKVQ